MEVSVCHAEMEQAPKEKARGQAEKKDPARGKTLVGPARDKAGRVAARVRAEVVPEEDKGQRTDVSTAAGRADIFDVDLKRAQVFDLFWSFRVNTASLIKMKLQFESLAPCKNRSTGFSCARPRWEASQVFLGSRNGGNRTANTASNLKTAGAIRSGNIYG